MNTERLIEDNMRLVFYLYNKLGQTALVLRNKDDIISEGFIGLIKAARSFEDGRVKFATYASRCIMNEMLMYIRKLRKQEREISLFAPLNIDADGNELLLMDILSDEGASLDALIEETGTEEKYRRYKAKLKDRERQVLDLRAKEYTQRQIADELGISQSYISRIIRKLKDKYKKSE